MSELLEHAPAERPAARGPVYTKELMLSLRESPVAQIKPVIAPEAPLQIFRGTRPVERPRRDSGSRPKPASSAPASGPTPATAPVRRDSGKGELLEPLDSRDGALTDKQMAQLFEEERLAARKRAAELKRQQGTPDPSMYDQRPATAGPPPQKSEADKILLGLLGISLSAPSAAKGPVEQLPPIDLSAVSTPPLRSTAPAGASRGGRWFKLEEDDSSAAEPPAPAPAPVPTPAPAPVPTPVPGPLHALLSAAALAPVASAPAPVPPTQERPLQPPGQALNLETLFQQARSSTVAMPPMPSVGQGAAPAGSLPPPGLPPQATAPVIPFQRHFQQQAPVLLAPQQLGQASQPILDPALSKWFGGAIPAIAPASLPARAVPIDVLEKRLENQPTAGRTAPLMGPPQPIAAMKSTAQPARKALDPGARAVASQGTESPPYVTAPSSPAATESTVPMPGARIVSGVPPPKSVR
eukprot:TRINITY_DN3931_c0_g1_i5.p1 TRINITY_DN3931_c0_g1~~TRINITY_DN3931_c0_g1_i5.p1  ORF type:complete len:468 (-),score=80.76 TRINITY_DN3931_c0_g1_i5:40-1443(-)